MNVEDRQSREVWESLVRCKKARKNRIMGFVPHFLSFIKNGG